MGGYERMYSKGHPEVTARLSVEPDLSMPLQGSACSQLLFWLGAVGLLAFAPITAVAIAVVMMASNPKPNSGSSMAVEFAVHPQRAISVKASKSRNANIAYVHTVGQ